MTHFDKNEWFILLSLLITFVILFRLPRRFPFSVCVLTYVFCFPASIVPDLIFGTPPFDLYDINDTPKYSLPDFLTWNMYSPFGYLFLYIYDRYRYRGFSMLLYIIICTCFAVGFEWLTIHAGIFRYKGWKLAYSIPTYLLVHTLYLSFFHWAMRIFHSTREQQKGPTA